MLATLISFFYRNRTLVELGAAVAMLAGFAIAWTLHSQHVGAARCEQRDDTKAVSEMHADLVESSRQSDTIAAEAGKYASDNLQPVSVPAVRVCYFKPAAANGMHAAAAAAGVRDGSVEPGDRDRERAGELADIKASYERLAKIGQHANAQLVELRDYVTNVCKPATAAAATR